MDITKRSNCSRCIIRKKMGECICTTCENEKCTKGFEKIHHCSIRAKTCNAYKDWITEITGGRNGS